MTRSVEPGRPIAPRDHRAVFLDLAKKIRAMKGRVTDAPPQPLALPPETRQAASEQHIAGEMRSLVDFLAGPPPPPPRERVVVDGKIVGESEKIGRVRAAQDFERWRQWRGD